MSVARALGVLTPGLLLFAVLWVPVLLRLSRRRSPSARRPVALEAWRSMSTRAQAAYDTAVVGAQHSAQGLAARQAEAAKRALFRP